MSSKCGICIKSVYPMDPQINLDGSIYHTVCAKCEDCRCQITISNFTKSGDTLLCKTHYFKRFNEQGNYLGGEKFAQKSTRGNTTFTPPAPPSTTTTSTTASSTDASSTTEQTPQDNERRKSLQERMKAFGGGGGNQTKCATCQRSVYPNDPQITLDGVAYHKECAKCVDCNCQITLANFCKFGTTLYCKTHYFKHFKEEGGYLGDDKYAHKSSSGAYIPKESSFVPKADGTSSEANSNNTTTTTDTTTSSSTEVTNKQAETIPNLESNSESNIDTTPTEESVEKVSEPIESTNDSNSNEPSTESEVVITTTPETTETENVATTETETQSDNVSSTIEEVNDAEGV